MVAAAVERFGRVDILVHGAGVGVHNEIVDADRRGVGPPDRRPAPRRLPAEPGGRPPADRAGRGRADHPDRLDGRQQRPHPERAARRLEGRRDPAGARDGARAGPARHHRERGVAGPDRHRRHLAVGPDAGVPAGVRDPGPARAGSPRPTRSPTPSSSSRRTGRASSPGRCCASTAATPPASWRSRGRTWRPLRSRSRPPGWSAPRLGGTRRPGDRLRGVRLEDRTGWATLPRSSGSIPAPCAPGCEAFSSSRTLPGHA